MQLNSWFQKVFWILSAGVLLVSCGGVPESRRHDGPRPDAEGALPVAARSVPESDHSPRAYIPRTELGEPVGALERSGAPERYGPSGPDVPSHASEPGEGGPAIVPASAAQPPETRVVPSVEEAIPEARRIRTEAPTDPRTEARTELHEDLVAQVESLVTAHWERISGGLGGDHVPDGRADDGLQAAAHLLAVTFLGEPRPTDLSCLRDAVALAGDPGSPRQYRLLAAACLERIGRPEDAQRIVGEVYAPVRAAPGTILPRALEPSEGERPAAGSGAFRLERVSFATRIEGPGQFTSADAEDLTPGATVYIYGEFRDAAAVLEQADTPGYRRHFSGNLTLLDRGGRVLDTIEFLPRERGAHVSPRPDDLVNFWARFSVPADLSAGPYRVAIHATDVLAGTSAREELQFDGGGQGAQVPR